MEGMSKTLHELLQAKKCKVEMKFIVLIAEKE
jgi:hypothetical protein